MHTVLKNELTNFLALRSLVKRSPGILIALLLDPSPSLKGMCPFLSIMFWHVLLLHCYFNVMQKAK